jgi:peroxiredoxin
MSLPRVSTPVPRAIADACVMLASGERVRLGSFWEDGKPAVILWLRHFGCVGCAQEVTELSPRLDELDRAGARVVLVGNGNREQLEGFTQRHGLADAHVVTATDPSLETYRAAGLMRSAWATFGPRSILDLARAMTAGHMHRGVEGDETQQGGALVVDARGVVRLLHDNHSIGDYVSASDVVEAVLRIEIETQADAVHI